MRMDSETRELKPSIKILNTFPMKKSGKSTTSSSNGFQKEQERSNHLRNQMLGKRKRVIEPEEEESE